MITYVDIFENFIKHRDEDKFDELYSAAPDELKTIMDKNIGVEQNPVAHPEKDVFEHIKTVTNRAWKYTHNIDMALAGFFHDIGKYLVTKPHNKKTEPVEVSGQKRAFFTSHGHEDESVKIVDQFRDWIQEMGGNPERIRNIVQFHMKMLSYDDMRPSRREQFEREPYFSDVKKFKEFDHGGTDI